MQYACTCADWFQQKWFRHCTRVYFERDGDYMDISDIAIQHLCGASDLLNSTGGVATTCDSGDLLACTEGVAHLEQESGIYVSN